VEGSETSVNRSGGREGDRRRIVVAITGASGAVFGIRILEILRMLGGYETHLVISRGSRSTLWEETGRTVADVGALADVSYPDTDLGAAIASGSFRTDGMIVAPCSIKTLSAVANCYSASLVARAADVTLKERRPLVLMVRETPLHRGHLRLMDQAAEAGAVLVPPVPAFYTQPTSVADIVDHIVARALDQLGIHTDVAPRWSGRNGRAGVPDHPGNRPASEPPSITNDAPVTNLDAGAAR
jgi:4-hydroxy-3-polyprenylbenzoate decarboxylase